VERHAKNLKIILGRDAIKILLGVERRINIVSSVVSI